LFFGGQEFTNRRALVWKLDGTFANNPFDTTCEPHLQPFRQWDRTPTVAAATWTYFYINNYSLDLSIMPQDLGGLQKGTDTAYFRTTSTAYPGVIRATPLMQNWNRSPTCSCEPDHSTSTLFDTWSLGRGDTVVHDFDYKIQSLASPCQNDYYHLLYPPPTVNSIVPNDATLHARIGSISASLLTIDPATYSSGVTEDLQGRIIGYKVIFDTWYGQISYPFNIHIEKDASCAKRPWP
jgi:hypothetical protein